MWNLIKGVVMIGNIKCNMDSFLLKKILEERKF